VSLFLVAASLVLLLVAFVLLGEARAENSAALRNLSEAKAYLEQAQDHRAAADEALEKCTSALDHADEALARCELYGLEPPSAP
jgi:hypothetical protein